jgi:hypothetical protein
VIQGIASLSTVSMKRNYTGRTASISGGKQSPRAKTGFKLFASRFELCAQSSSCKIA